MVGQCILPIPHKKGGLPPPKGGANEVTKTVHPCPNGGSVSGWLGQLQHDRYPW
jgi:hypothetical protein